MMEFHTELSVKKNPDGLSLQDKIITIGSCFSDDVGKKLFQNKFNVLINPFGTVYNPISIHQLLMMATNHTVPPEGGYIERDEVYYHYGFHSSWNDKTLPALQFRLKEQIQKVHLAVAGCRCVIITYGTAWVYEHLATKSIVANCHKIPQRYFEKKLLTQKRILESFEGFYAQMKKINPTLRIILTVSPVRHIKDTLELNSVSKSILRLACHTLTQTFDGVNYFPAYEIMMDDLRDYRFYGSDMIHPSRQAVDYIWEKFCESLLSAETNEFIGEWKKIRAALKHKPFHPESPSHQKFLQETLDKLHRLKNQADVSDEIESVRMQIKGR